MIQDKTEMVMEWRLDCACHRGMDVVCGSKSHAVADFKKAGWVRTRQRGWICPECAEKQEWNNFHKED